MGSKRKMKNKSNKIISVRGMTMAEMLTVVAIIVILSGVAFIALFNYQRSLAQLERDNTAKEIFIAAQNHLTMARGEGYMLSKAEMKNDSSDKFGVVKKLDGNDICCILINNGSIASIDSETKGKWMYDIMLPFGAVDGTVVGGGSILIRYQKETGAVIDVFYCTTGSDRFDHTLFEGDDYTSITSMAGDDADLKEARKHYVDNSVLGWYGGGDLQDLGNFLEPPEISVENGAKLSVSIKENYREDGGIPVAGQEKLTDGTAMRLIIEGEQSGAKLYFPANWTVRTPETADNIIYKPKGTIISESDPEIKTTIDEHIFILDDITTKDMSFYGLFVKNATTSNSAKGPDNLGFIPGENLKIKAVVFNKDNIANIAYSNEVVTNSLFASADDQNLTDESDLDTAYIGNIRHLENLDERVSNLDINENADGSSKLGGKVNIVAAKQIDNIIWKDDVPETKDFTNEINPKTGNAPSIFYGATSTNGVYLPVDPLVIDQIANSFTYDGQMHSISSVTAKGIARTEGQAYGGLFGNLSNLSNYLIRNLELVDFKIDDAGNAGALAGYMKNATVTNVIARNTIEYERSFPSIADPNKKDLTSEVAADISGTISVGGLIGEAKDVKINKSAASLIINGTATANVGGLVGSFESTSSNVVDGELEHSGSITGCYSGGHTERGEYYKHSADGTRAKTQAGEEIPIYNVQSAGGSAGGLVGSMTGGSISYSYSTCSASGSASGGFIGTASGSPAVNDCYATGLIKVTAEKKEDFENIDPFVGNGSNYLSSSSTGDKYYSIVNEFKDDKDEILYLEPQLIEANKGNITAIDGSTDSYDAFVTDNNTTNWADAVSYDHYISGAKAGNGYVYSLEEWYGNKYNLKTVEQLGAMGINDGQDYVSVHYGDWPAPEIFFINTPNS